MSGHKSLSTILPAILLCGVASISNLTSASAQEVRRPAVHPGDVLKYDVRVEGSEAEQFSSALLRINLTTPVREDQNTLQTLVDTSWVPKERDHLFHMSLTVPKFVATGDYAFTLLIAVDLNGGPRFTYEPSELSVPVVHIENDYKVHKPKVVVIPRP